MSLLKGKNILCRY